MAGYLDQYGKGDARREKWIKRTIAIVLSVLVIWAAAAILLHNRTENNQVITFLNLLQNKDYQSAYHLFGCTEQTPCRDYSFEKFQEDWGPGGRFATIGSHKVVRSRACGTGVIVTVAVDSREEQFWVEKDNKTVGFSPWPACPESSLGNMILDKLADWVRV